MMAAGAAGAAAVWVAPSVLSLDRVDAATGTCGVKPVQVDMTQFAGGAVPQAPTTFNAVDGTVVSMTLSDPFGNLSPTWQMDILSPAIGGVDHPALILSTGMNNGETVTVTFTFSAPVEPSFFLVDVDRATNGWEDTVTVTGSLGGGGPINPDSMTPAGGSVTQISPNTVRGVSSTGTSSGNVEVDFQTPIDTLTIVHRDDTAWTGGQWIGIHDLHWC